MKAVLFVYLAFLMLLPFSSQGEEKTAPLKIGMELSYPPFEMVGPDGQPCGISVELAKALGHFLNREITIVNIPFIGLIPSLKQGKIDLIISSMTATKERKASIDFSDPYLTIGLALLASQKSTIKNIEEANQKGRVIVVKSGTSSESFAKKNLTNAKVIILDKESACVLEVSQGKADGFIYDQLSIYTNWQKHPNTTRAILTPFEIQSWAIGVRKGNQQLLDQVNGFLKEFRKNGGFEILGDDFLYEQKKAFKKLNIPFVF